MKISTHELPVVPYTTSSLPDSWDKKSFEVIVSICKKHSDRLKSFKDIIVYKKNIELVDNKTQEFYVFVLTTTHRKIEIMEEAFAPILSSFRKECSTIPTEHTFIHVSTLPFFNKLSYYGGVMTTGVRVVWRT